MNAEAATIARDIVGVVKRSRAGDQNASAMLYRIGEEARKGSSPRAIIAYKAAAAYMDANPAVPFELGGEPALVADPPSSTAIVRAAQPDEAALDKPKLSRADRELQKPPLPRGIFDRLFDPEWMALIIVRACQYRDGMPAAAVVLAGGPPLTAPLLNEIGKENFGTSQGRGLFFHGVKFSGEDDWEKVAPHLDVPSRRCFAIGQCLGRARKIQAVRQPGSAISGYSAVAGWELGE